MELKHQQDEASIRTSFQNDLQEVIESEEKRVKSECKAMLKHKEMNTQNVVEDINYEYKDRKHNLIGKNKKFRIMIMIMIMIMIIIMII